MLNLAVSVYQLLYIPESKIAVLRLELTVMIKGGVVATLHCTTLEVSVPLIFLITVNSLKCGYV